MRPRPRRDPQRLLWDQIFRGLSRPALPAAILFGACLLWLGAYAPNGAFQSGPLIAAVGIVLILERLRVLRDAVMSWLAALFIEPASREQAA
jgi:multisubunit Na+/H+ antiporter MnhB subunit